VVPIERVRPHRPAARRSARGASGSFSGPPNAVAL